MPLGNSKVSSGGRMTLFTACLGILRLETHRGQYFLFTLCASVVPFHANAFWHVIFYSVPSTSLHEVSSFCPPPPVPLLCQDVISAQAGRSRCGPPQGAEHRGASVRPRPHPPPSRRSIIDAPLLTHGRWRHNTTQVR